MVVGYYVPNLCSFSGPSARGLYSQFTYIAVENELDSDEEITHTVNKLAHVQPPCEVVGSWPYD